MELRTYDLTKGIEVSYENILKMHFVPNSNKLVLLKVNSSWGLFVEIVDFDSFLTTIITLDNKLRIYYREFEHNSFVDYSKCLDDSIVFSLKHIFEFYFSDDLEFIYLRARLNNSAEQVCHFKIDLEGKIVNEKIENSSYDSVYAYSHLKKYLINDNFVFLDLDNFTEHDLVDFFDKTFENDNFLYLGFNDGRYSIFTLPDKNLFGLIFFDKDDNYPRGSFNIFKINDIKKPELIFSFRIDEFGDHHTFNPSGNKIAYCKYLDFDEIEIKIRELYQNEFENAIEFNIPYSKEDSSPEEIILSDANFIIIVFNNRFEVYNIYTQEQMAVYNRDIRTLYCFGENKLFYIYLNKLKMEFLG
ncbi:hypothetical protein [Flavobacterium pectinovorum]|uniref:Uncharacterized protein n=1 Tax=Flavobacterium pectinovorum TaxID=29533 RepID=A0A502EKL7_9FLAO|nr:hypothetical protein [Flavobacterium pectinovorum]TPG37522.1 hypothetical protein EAH81_18700 [Flavobacterium pectinovorum]